MSARGSTPLPELAARLRQLADWAEQGRLAGLSVVGLESGNHQAVAIVYTPQQQREAAALFGGLVVNSAIAAIAGGLPPAQAADIISAEIAAMLEERS